MDTNYMDVLHITTLDLHRHINYTPAQIPHNAA